MARDRSDISLAKAPVVSLRSRVLALGPLLFVLATCAAFIESTPFILQRDIAVMDRSAISNRL
jgi:hypothetical protein